jgi:hypothetical protein
MTAGRIVVRQFMMENSGGAGVLSDQNQRKSRECDLSPAWARALL